MFGQLHYDFFVLHLHVERSLENFARLSEIALCFLVTSLEPLAEGFEIIKVFDLIKDCVAVECGFFVKLPHLGL